MKIFITGASGYIGNAVAQAFAQAGHRVYGLVRSQEKGRLLAAAEIEPVLGTMQDPESYGEVARACSVLIHCAMEYSPQSTELERRTMDALISYARQSGKPRTVIYTSGVWQYGNTGMEAVDETAPSNPPAYVAGRVPTEKSVLEGNSGLVRTLIIRPGCVYGGSGSLTADWFSDATKHGAARIVGDGSYRWTMIHLHDLAQLYLRAGESSYGGEIFNATDRSRFTILECATAASRAAGSGRVIQVPLEEAIKKMGPIATCLALDQHVDSSKAVRLLGWQPRHGGFVDGVDRYYLAWKATQG
jgi:nucleoside-diphosphate-sugar epimerase